MNGLGDHSAKQKNYNGALCVRIRDALKKE